MPISTKLQPGGAQLKRRACEHGKQLKLLVDVDDVLNLLPFFQSLEVASVISLQDSALYF